MTVGHVNTARKTYATVFN